MRRSLPSLTSIRFVAAAFVVLHHTAGRWQQTELTKALFTRYGWLGVGLFFVLSGFVLMWSFDSTKSVGDFIARRIARIYPLHLMTLAISLLAFVSLGTPLAGYVGRPIGTIASLFLTHGWVPWHPEVRQAWNGVSWTLSCEFFFYLLAPFLFPFLIRNYHRSILPVCLALAWLCLVGACIVGQTNGSARLLDLLLMHPVFRALEFVVGAYCALLVKHGLCQSISPALGLSMFALPIVAHHFAEPGINISAATLSYLCLPGALAIVVGLAQADVTDKPSVLHHPALVFLGEASFSLYMTHALLLGAILFAARRCGVNLFGEGLACGLVGDASTIVFLLLAIATSWLTFVGFETRIRKRLLGPPKRS